MRLFASTLFLTGCLSLPVYRASFCRTFEECKRSSEGEWKSVLAGTLFFASVGLWIFILIKKYGMSRTTLSSTVPLSVPPLSLCHGPQCVLLCQSPAHLR